MEDRIVSVFAQQIIDCKCRPAVEVEIRTDGRKLGILPEGYVDYTQEEFRRVLDKVFERHDATFRKLAE